MVNLWQEMSFGFASDQLWPKSKHSVILPKCNLYLSKLLNIFVNHLLQTRCPAAPTCICLAFLKVSKFHLWPKIALCPPFKKKTSYKIRSIGHCSSSLNPVMCTMGTNALSVVVCRPPLFPRIDCAQPYGGKLRGESLLCLLRNVSLNPGLSPTEGPF